MKIRRLLLALGAMALGITVLAQTDSGMSHQMQLAIECYEEGDDTRAMDWFFEVLAKGAPSERAMANEYLNQLVYRMASTSPTTVLKPAPPSPVEPVEKPAPPVPAAAPAPAAPPVSIPVVHAPAAAPAPAATPVAIPAVPVPVPAPAPVTVVQPKAAPLPPPDKELVIKESQAKRHLMQEAGLQKLQACEGLRIVKNESGELRAIGIPSALLFSSGISFRKEAGEILDALTSLLYSLGRTQVFILPEGAVVADAKILDMRRVMGINAYFLQAGLAAPRVRVNLLSNQVDVPKPLQDFQGVILVFIYDRPMRLAMENFLSDVPGGPPITLGAYPSAFRPDKNESILIEFSVSEPFCGLMSWRFQLRPPASGVAEPIPLQEVIGGGPVFHQIYWNGRSNYFGAVLPAGRYECVLSATDAKNRTKTLHRWIELLGRPQAFPVGTKPGTLIKESKPPVKVKIAPKKAKKPAKRKGLHRTKTKAAKKAPVATAQAYTIAFQANSHQMTPDGKQMLAKAVGTLPSHAEENLVLMGYAHSSEPDAGALSQRRAQMVAGLLINKYQVEPKRVHIQSAVSEDPGDRRVEIRFAAKEQQ